MNLKTLMFTENLCYKRNVDKHDSRYTTFQSRGPQGIMVHSTGANNPWLKRYVGPDDGQLGKNAYNNHWNQLMDRLVCVHGFIGKLADGSVATYQTLPWNFRGWHCAGDGNNTHISFEICEDGLEDPVYFGKVYQEAVDLCVYLCKMFPNLTAKDIICHSEGHDKGIASNHGDVMHWFPKHGKSMDTFRAAVQAALDAEKDPDPKPETEAPSADSDFKEGDVVSIAAGATYYGSSKKVPDWVLAKKWIVKEDPDGNRVVIDKSVDGKNAICSPIHAKYLTKEATPEPYVPKKGDIVQFKAKVHYRSANGTKAYRCTPGKARISEEPYMVGKSKHPYHLIGINCTVHGWVDADSFTKA